MKALWVGSLALLAAAILAGGVASAGASSGPAPRLGQILGIVPSLHLGSTQLSFGTNLRYHNGPVEHTNTVYAIYWVPSGYTTSANYRLRTLGRLLDGLVALVVDVGAPARHERRVETLLDRLLRDHAFGDVLT